MKSLGDTGSLICAYMLQVCLNHYYGSSWVAACVIILAGACKFANGLITILSDDIENGVGMRIECISALGERFVVFRDHVIITTNWLALTALKDAMVHSRFNLFVLRFTQIERGSGLFDRLYKVGTFTRMSLIIFNTLMGIIRKKRFLLKHFVIIWG